jgi:hypothetical protein
MITRLTAETLQGAKLTPAATAAVSPDWFKLFGVTFVQDEDDLDSYEFAGIGSKDWPADCCATHIRRRLKPHC